MPLYSDLHQDNPRKKVLLEDAEAVIQSINTILSTLPGERFFNPQFGSNMESLLFELIDDPARIAFQAETLLFADIESQDNRVTLDTQQTQVSAVPEDHRLDLSLALNIKGITNYYEYKAVQLAR